MKVDHTEKLNNVSSNWTDTRRRSIRFFVITLLAITGLLLVFIAPNSKLADRYHKLFLENKKC